MNEKIKCILKGSILYPVVLIKRYYERYLSRNNPKKLIAMWYKNETGEKLNIDHPVTLQEKINYLSFYTDTSMWTQLADKIKVRDYVSACGFSDVLNDLYAVYKGPNEIDYDKLPVSFVLKTNHASATNILVKDKRQLDYKKTNSQLERWLKQNYGLNTAQPHYSRIDPKIMAERYLIDGDETNKLLPDYKFFCLNGLPKCVFVLTDREPNTHNVKRMFYDMDWQPHQEWLQEGRPIGNLLPKPKSFDKMVGMATILAKPFPFVRVDFYEIDGKPVFGEMTFTPGHDEASPLFLKTFGIALDISEYIKK